ncbi:carboxyl transferase domain-containing protein [Saccharicrinis sp. FJH54]|uniref:carboxyl transferase domain-containing protein n=1 Tax=Saccharicrinis sp. FJH54 TaxID=3344665 RepID=UPI0035D51EC6
MEKLTSHIIPGSKSFTENRNAFELLMDEYRGRLGAILQRDSEKPVIRHRERGKLTARERIDHLIDPHTSFLEFSALAANGQYSDGFPSAGIITGIGLIRNIETVIIANDATVKGGTYVKETIKKHIRALEVALANHLPAVFLVDSGGVFLPEQINVFPDRDHFGRIFYLQSQLSSKQIPQVAIVMGSCTAGGAYIPAMSDESIIVQNQGTIFLGGPPLVKAATGEDVTAEDLGGGHVHTSVSGVADHLAEDDLDALRICRDIFSTLTPPQKHQVRMEKAVPPVYDPYELYGIIPARQSKQMEMYEVIARVVDGSEFQEFKANYGKTLITGFARIHGYTVGIVANNGILFPESALKGTHFIELCNYRKIPLLFFQNITGFMIGKDYEHKGIAKEGAKMVHAVATSNVPKITVIVGGSYGAGNYAMAGRAYDPDFLFMWPNARIAVMGGTQAANVLSTVKIQQMQATGNPVDIDELEKFKKEITDRYDVESSAYFSTSRLWDDGIIDPADTRDVLGMAISAALCKKVGDPQPGVFRF